MGSLFVVATPIGNLADISKRAIETLENVDIILCEDTRHSLKLLNYYNIKNKLISYHKFNEVERSSSVIEKLKSGLDIAIITDAGTPCVSDPGYVLIKKAKEEGIEVIGVGGISALVTALSVSGINSDTFTFYGFFPRENKDKKSVINEILESKIRTYIFYESPKRIIKTLKYIYENLGDVLISVSSDLTKIHEKNYYGRLSNVLKIMESNPNIELGEYVFIIENDIVRESVINNDISIEALLIDVVVKNNFSIKEGIDYLSKNSDYSKKDIYNASLNLKKIK